MAEGTRRNSNEIGDPEPLLYCPPEPIVGTALALWIGQRSGEFNIRHSSRRILLLVTEFKDANFETRYAHRD